MTQSIFFQTNCTTQLDMLLHIFLLQTGQYYFYYHIHQLNNLAAHSRIFRYELAAYIYF